MSLFSRTQWQVTGGCGSGGSGQVLVSSGVGSTLWAYPVIKPTGDLFRFLSKLGIKSTDKFSTITTISAGGGLTVTLPQPVAGVNYTISYNTIPEDE